MLDIEQRPNPLPAFTIPIIPVMFVLLAILATGAVPPPAEESPDEPSGEMNEAERAFSELLAGAVLTGRFTVDGDDSPPKQEKYEIVAATKAGENDWVIVARMKFGKTDVRVPIPVKVHWAGDTPVLSLTDLTIPGLGTFTSRVMFYGDRYAGTWQHGEKGGHLFGTIGKAEEESTEQADEVEDVERQTDERIDRQTDSAAPGQSDAADTLEGLLRVHPKWHYKYYIEGVGGGLHCGLFQADDRLKKIEPGTLVRVRGDVKSRYFGDRNPDPRTSALASAWIIFMNVDDVEVVRREGR